MQNFNHLITTRPHDISTVFVSDLHLSADTPALNQAFLALLKDLSFLPNLTHLYILGDWLDGWIGDDDYLSLNDNAKKQHFLTPILSALQHLSTTAKIHVMHGNRDFAIRQTLCDEFEGRLIKEPYCLQSGQLYRLEHGDRLCTDDKAYQRYRKIVQTPLIAWLILKQPLAKRRQIANKIKAKSTHDKSGKSKHIMDVNSQAVQQALTTCDVLIHGHTHHPAIHEMTNKKRVVLGDWRHQDGGVQAVIGVMVGNQVDLWTFKWRA
ncbi:MULTISPECIES: UDP-2,3-diacylglucosamine diphosphatase [unclassified Moraxella]|uniref:UDP-2,3-diacylglucosamine diphosphatase n=1 Tax=unclassified Moraxella TaxID=2685852 RepID=UPI00359E0CD0